MGGVGGEDRPIRGPTGYDIDGVAPPELCGCYRIAPALPLFVSDGGVGGVGRRSRCKTGAGRLMELDYPDAVGGSSWTAPVFPGSLREVGGRGGAGDGRLGRTSTG